VINFRNSSEVTGSISFAKRRAAKPTEAQILLE
jgi:hypothetical protein